MDPESGRDVPPKKRGRRSLLVALAALSAVGAGALGWNAVQRSDEEKRRAEASSLAARSRETLKEGRVLEAVAEAAKALELSPEDADVQRAWVHAEGMALIEGSPDAVRATGFLYKTWRFELRGPTLAFATLAHAIAVGNDRYAEKLVEQHERQSVPEDALHLFATGAALDLMCAAKRAETVFARAAELWEGAKLPIVRRVRSLLLEDRPGDAAALLPSTSGVARDLLAHVVGRLEGKRLDPLWLDREAIADMPRSLRALAYVSTMSEENQVPIEVLLEDVDSALAADLCGRVALRAKDLASAQLAVDRACKLRPELAVAQTRLIAIMLLRGDLQAAKKRAELTQDRDELLRVDAISAYEKGDVAALRKLAGEQPESEASFVWPTIVVAISLLEKQPVVESHLQARVDAFEPWADLLLFDAALASRNEATMDKVAASWTELTPARQARLDKRKSAQPSK